MATGPFHYAEAERLIEGALALDEDGADMRVIVMTALVHSNLAVAASQALRNHEGLPERDRKAWFEVAATKSAPAVKPVEDAAA